MQLQELLLKLGPARGRDGPWDEDIGRWKSLKVFNSQIPLASRSSPSPNLGAVQRPPWKQMPCKMSFAFLKIRLHHHSSPLGQWNRLTSQSELERTVSIPRGSAHTSKEWQTWPACAMGTNGGHMAVDLRWTSRGVENKAGLQSIR